MSFLPGGGGGGGSDKVRIQGESVSDTKLPYCSVIFADNHASLDTSIRYIWDLY